MWVSGGSYECTTLKRAAHSTEENMELSVSTMVKGTIKGRLRREESGVRKLRDSQNLFKTVIRVNECKSVFRTHMHTHTHACMYHTHAHVQEMSLHLAVGNLKKAIQCVKCGDPCAR